MKRKTVIWTVILLLLLGFIWGHSMMPNSRSEAESAAVGNFLTPLLEWFVGEGNVTDHLVRKLAHFCEFGALGVVLGLLLQVRQHTDFWAVSYMLFVAVTVAVIDEAIQLVSDGRGSRVTDVLLDTGGAATGLLGILLLGFLFCRRRKT